MGLEGAYRRRGVLSGGLWMEKQVHKAINLSSGAAVAVKLVGKDKLRRPHERQSIEKEIETMRVAVEKFENGHPHIVRLLCTKESQTHIFIVQVRGITVGK